MPGGVLSLRKIDLPGLWVLKDEYLALTPRRNKMGE